MNKNPLTRLTLPMEDCHVNEKFNPGFWTA